jgi:hypothetical protein
VLRGLLVVVRVVVRLRGKVLLGVVAGGIGLHPVLGILQRWGVRRHPEVVVAGVEVVEKVEVKVGRKGEGGVVEEMG